jgi:hypothetical protein
MARTCIDAHNLALSRGSGIATQPRNPQTRLNVMGREAQPSRLERLDLEPALQRPST